jgi:hypothetical protein
MNQMTYLYAALAAARQTVTELERAIEARVSTPSGYTGLGYGNADSNGNRDTLPPSTKDYNDR